MFSAGITEITSSKQSQSKLKTHWSLTDYICHIWHTPYNFPFLILNSRSEIPSTRQYFPSFAYISTLKLHQIKTILTFVSVLHTVNITIPTNVYLGINPHILNDNQCYSHFASHTRELFLQQCYSTTIDHRAAMNGTTRNTSRRRITLFCYMHASPPQSTVLHKVVICASISLLNSLP